MDGDTIGQAADAERTHILGVAPAVAVRLEPAGVAFGAVPGQSLLEAAAAAGWRLPRSCRNGTCRACRCRLVAGAVRYRIDWPGLSREEHAEGWILPCVAEPAGPVTIDQPAARPQVAG